MTLTLIYWLRPPCSVLFVVIQSQAIENWSEKPAEGPTKKSPGEGTPNPQIVPSSTNFPSLAPPSPH